MPPDPAAGRSPAGGEHPHATLLRALYADMTLLARYAANDIRLHSHGTAPLLAGTWTGRDAVLTRQAALWAAAPGTLRLVPHRISADDSFGTVIGRLTAHRDGHRLDTDICGVWRFTGGRPAEHWEHCADWAAADRFFAEVPAPPAAPAETVVVIAVFTTDPRRRRDLLDDLAALTDRVVRHAPGFLTADILPSPDGRSVAIHAHWTNTHAADAAMHLPDAQAFHQRIGAYATFDRRYYHPAAHLSFRASGASRSAGTSAASPPVPSPEAPA
ncbi:nuclear transport factor 2 family protein [Streptomyces sp. NPDC088755]|uniref:nuclear transport factor 2 family protein n=1 Tax=Streptomyces sp. NPDC088755 TaxID=3365888 RepID=UPI00381CEBFD